MKFKHYLETISGIGIYPMISLILFVSFFILVTIWAFSFNKKIINKMENLPLEK